MTEIAKKDGYLTVAQLIEELQKIPGDLVVLLEGCDCIGAAAGVDPPEPEFNGDPPSVLITR